MRYLAVNWEEEPLFASNEQDEDTKNDVMRSNRWELQKPLWQLPLIFFLVLVLVVVAIVVVVVVSVRFSERNIPEDNMHNRPAQNPLF